MQAAKISIVFSPPHFLQVEFVITSTNFKVRESYASLVETTNLTTCSRPCNIILRYAKSKKWENKNPSSWRNRDFANFLCVRGFGIKVETSADVMTRQKQDTFVDKTTVFDCIKCAIVCINATFCFYILIKKTKIRTLICTKWTKIGIKRAQYWYCG